MLANPLLTPLVGIVNRVRAWPVTAQQHARRNAMIAATACAQRRVEREEIEDYLDHHDRPHEQPTAAPAHG